MSFRHIHKSSNGLLANNALSNLQYKSQALPFHEGKCLEEKKNNTLSFQTKEHLAPWLCCHKLCMLNLSFESWRKKNITIEKVFLPTCGSYFLRSSLLFLYSDVTHTHQRVDDSLYLYKVILSCIIKP